MITQHDQLMAKAAKFSDEAQTHYNDVVVRQAAIKKEVQAKIEANAIYDWKYDLKLAGDCWNDLNVVEDILREQRQRLARMRAELGAEQQRFTPDPSIYTLSTQPPMPPSPTALPNLGSVYMPPRSPLPYSPAAPGPFLGRVPGGPDVYGVPAGAIAPAQGPTLGPAPQTLGGPN